MELSLKDKVEKIKEKVGPNHSAYKQAAMDLDRHNDGKLCEKKYCVIEFEYNKINKSDKKI